MSMFGTTVKSNLPEDIEARLAKIQETISLSEAKIISLTNEINAKKAELATLESKVFDARADYSNRVASSDKITIELKERETKISQKESALDIYANALKEKEDKINKYLSVFENMKSAISK